MIYKLLKKAAYFSFAIFFVVVTSELYLQKFSPESIFSNATTSQFGNATAFRANYHEKVFFDDFPFTLKTDSRHLRTFRNIDYEKPDDVFRVLCIGGSIFAASGVNNNETFAYYLEKILTERIKGKRFEVVNAGKNLWELAEFFTFLKNEGKKYSPDLIVAYHHTGELGTFDLSEILADQLSLEAISKQKGLIKIKGINFDIRVRPLMAHTLNFIQNIPGYDSLFPKSHLLRFMERNIRKRLVRPTSPNNNIPKNLKYFLDRPAIGQLSSFDIDTPYGIIKNVSKKRLEPVFYSVAFEKFSDLVEELEAKLLMLIVPSPKEIFEVSVLPQNLKPHLIREKKTIVWFDLIESLKKLQRSYLFPINFPEKIHWTPSGHQIVANLAYNKLLEADFLPITKENNLSFNFSQPEAANTFENSNRRIQPTLIKTGYLNYLKGIVYKNRKEYNKAIGFLLEYSKLHSNNHEIFVLLGEIFLEQKQPRKAIPYFLKALELKDFKDSGISIQLGNSFYMSGQLTQAENLLRQAVAIDSNNYQNYYFLGNFLYSTKRYKEAVAQFKKSLTLKPGENIVLEALGGSYFKLGQWKQSAQIFEEIVKNNPQNQTALATLDFIQKQNQ